MSLILDALRKSDRERQRNAAERLREGPQPAGVSAPPAWMMPLLLAALLTSLSALAWVILSQDQPLTGNQAGQPGEKVENNAPRGAVRPLGAELARARPASAPPSTDTAGGATVETATDPAPAEPEPLPPSLEEMPEAFRAGLPKLVVNAHAWSTDPASRFVLVNLHRYEEGDQLAEGPRLMQIRPEGLVLEFQGELFFLSRR